MAHTGDFENDTTSDAPPFYLSCIYSEANGGADPTNVLTMNIASTPYGPYELDPGTGILFYPAIAIADAVASTWHVSTGVANIHLHASIGPRNNGIPIQALSVGLPLSVQNLGPAATTINLTLAYFSIIGGFITPAALPGGISATINGTTLTTGSHTGSIAYSSTITISAVSGIPGSGFLYALMVFA